jgi:pilus assembly protein CpaF
MTHTPRPLGDPLAVARTVHDAVAGLGPLQRFLDDPTVEEIWINDSAGS